MMAGRRIMARLGVENLIAAALVWGSIMLPSSAFGCDGAAAAKIPVLAAVVHLAR
jgi:hypothetical protein